MTTLGKYELQEIIGKGGYGVVYRARDLSLGRNVALKVLHPQLAVDVEFVEAFQREARLAAEIENTHAVTIYEVGEESGRYFIAMRYYPGGSLAERMQTGPLSWEESVAILSQVCEGLQKLHERGWVHRDMKPSNILFDAEGRAVVSDFGLARALSSSGSSTSGSAGAGTPFYRAPELWRGTPAPSPATDVYSLGCILAEMLSGQAPFGGKTPDEIITRHLVEGPRFGENWPPPGSPDGVDELVRGMLAIDPERRCPNPQQVASELRRLSRPAPVASPEPQTLPPTEQLAPVSPPTRGLPRWSWAAVGVAVVLLVTVAALLIFQEPAAGAVQISPIDQMAQVYVPSGKFLMGVKTQKDGADNDELPQHSVYLSGFWIDRTEVTNAMYERCVQAGVCSAPRDINSATRSPYYGKIDFANFPVINVDWTQARIYCEWAGRRLPTEAEWEKAARGTNGRGNPWGEARASAELLNFDQNTGDTTAVGSYPAGASPYGALDMAGNVWEWTADWYGGDYYASSPRRNPTGPETGTLKALRGGSWADGWNSQRTTDRYDPQPASIDYRFGFRCASD